MSELLSSVRQHYEKNEADSSLVSKVTKMLDSLPEGFVDSSQVSALDQFHVMGLEATETSFLLSEDETSSVLATAGFTVTTWNDISAEALTWMGQQRPAAQGLNLGLVMGPRFAEMGANLARNVREGRVRFVMAVCTADRARN